MLLPAKSSSGLGCAFDFFIGSDAIVLHSSVPFICALATLKRIEVSDFARFVKLEHNGHFIRRDGAGNLCAEAN